MVKKDHRVDPVPLNVDTSYFEEVTYAIPTIAVCVGDYDAHSRFVDIENVAESDVQTELTTFVEFVAVAFVVGFVQTPPSSS
jgi:hypothetical protein